MPDDASVVAVELQAQIDQLKVGLAEAQQSLGTFGSVGTQGFQKTTEASNELLGAIAGGGHARHLRLISMELGSLAGAGQLASRETFALLGGLNALDEGLNTLGGPIGMVIAAVGVLATAYVYLADKHKKANEEAKKEYDLYHEHLARDEKEQAATIAEIAERYARLGNETALHIVRQERINKLREEEGRINSALSELLVKNDPRDKAKVARLRELIELIEREIAATRTLSFVMNTQDAKVREEIIDADRLGKAHVAAAEAAAKAWEKAEERMASALVSAAHAHENFFKAIFHDAQQTAEKVLASKAIKIAFSILLPGMGAMAMGGLNTMASGASSLTQGLSNAASRQGDK